MNSLIPKYIFFAFLATLINLSTQFFILNIYSGNGRLYFAMVLGTLLGMILKYFLDKKFIFKFKGNKNIDEVKSIFLYGLVSGLSTFIFWAFEVGFHFLFNDYRAKYLGAVLGLSIGYSIKYYLDKKIVFK